MHTLHISYDLYRADSRDYANVFDRIKGLTTGKWCHPVQSTWFVETPYDAQQFMQHLNTALQTGDKVVVTEVDRSANSWFQNIDPADLEYLQTHVFYVSPYRRPGYID